MRRLPILLVAATLCAGGILRIWLAETSWDGAMLAAAGLVLVGSWLALEIRDRDHDQDHE